MYRSAGLDADSIVATVFEALGRQKPERDAQLA
jgi:hypothetical protein